MNICGNCLHDKDSHTEHSKELMYCSCCLKICDIQEFNTQHHSSKILIHDGMVCNMNTMEKKK